MNPAAGAEPPPETLPRLYGEDFAADPQPTCARLRAAGPVAWASPGEGVAALVITDYRAAVAMLNDTDTYSKDARRWRALAAGRIPPDSAVLTLMARRPSLLYADGPDHARLRQVMDDCLARITTHRLEELTSQCAKGLLDHMAPRGQAELMTDYAITVPLLVFADLLGCPAQMSARLVTACEGMIAAGPSAAAAGADLAACLGELIAIKKAQPGADVTSWMLAHPARLTDEEIAHQQVVFVGAGNVPTAAWIAHTVRLLLAEDDYAGPLAGGVIPVRRALNKALWDHSPMAFFSVHYARRDTVLHGVPVPAGVPVMVGHAATNTDPALPRGITYDNRGHLAWSAGPHRCPADSHATAIAQAAVIALLDRLPDIRLTGTVRNRPGPFHQCPVALHAEFTAEPARASGADAP